MFNPKITVVTVCYNVSEELSKTICSVANQTYNNIEYIVVDGGSNDNTLEVINVNKQYISQFVSERDNGIYDAMNKGIDMSSGDWIVFMNAGDLFYDENVLTDVFSKHDYSDEVKLIYGDVMLNFGKLGYLPKRFKNIDQDQTEYEICHQGVFTKSDILKQIKYDTTFKIGADCNSFATIKKLGYRFEYIPLFISIFEIVDGVSSRMIMQAYYEHCKIMGVNPWGIRMFFYTISKWVKSILYKLLPYDIYNQLRYNSILNRKQYH